VGDGVVVNASPLIFLAGAGLLEFLKVPGGRVVVPAAVADEILCRGNSDAAAAALNDNPWLEPVERLPVPPEIQAWDLGAGESAVLSWVLMHQGMEAVIDDLAARRCAAVLGIPVRGTLGLVPTAKKQRRIEKARPVLSRLRSAGMYLSDRVLDEALKLVGE
jgi:predicted nucleic acid-binding protein